MKAKSLTLMALFGLIASIVGYSGSVLAADDPFEEPSDGHIIVIHNNGSVSAEKVKEDQSKIQGQDIAANDRKPVFEVAPGPMLAMNDAPKAQEDLPSIVVEEDGTVTTHEALNNGLHEGQVESSEVPATDTLNQQETNDEKPTDEATLEKENKAQDAIREMDDQKKQAEDIAQGLDNLND